MYPLGVSAKEPSDDVAVEVLVRCQASIEATLLSAPGQQSLAYARRREPSADLFPNLCGVFLSILEVGGHCGFVPQVARNHQSRHPAGTLRSTVQRSPVRPHGHRTPRRSCGATLAYLHTDDAVSVGVNRNLFNHVGQVRVRTRNRLRPQEFGRDGFEMTDCCSR